MKRDARRQVAHVGKRGGVDCVRVRKTHHESVDRQLAKTLCGIAQTREFARVGNIQRVALAHHYPKGNTHTCEGRFDQIKRRCQPILVEVRNNFQPCRAALLCRQRVVERAEMTSNIIRYGLLAIGCWQSLLANSQLQIANHEDAPL